MNYCNLREELIKLLQDGAPLWCIGFQKVQDQGVSILGGWNLNFLLENCCCYFDSNINNNSSNYNKNQTATTQQLQQVCISSN